MLILFLATVVGALTTSVLGWLDTGNPFDARKFAPGVIRGIVAAIVVFIASYEGFLGEVTMFTYLAAFIAGMAVDVAGNRIAGILNIGQGKTATPTPNPT
jgi:hypothetical protein